MSIFKIIFVIILFLLMKIIHTGDWHIGHLLYNWDRTDEHQRFFDSLLDVVMDENPDALVISGDVFHTAAPSSAARRLYIDNMLRLHQARPEMEVIVIAGNHDSSALIDVDSTLWKHFNLHALGAVSRSCDEDSLDRHIIKVGNPAIGYVIAVPHCYPQNYPALEEDMPREKRPAAFFKALLDRVSSINEEGLPVIMTAHATVLGSNPRKQDIIVGGLDSISLSQLGDGYDYLALGHIHYPQNIGTKARYAGSPVPVSFNEDYPHSVSIVEIERYGSEPMVRSIDIPVLRNVVTLPEEPVDFEEALRLLEDFPDDKEAYIRLNVKVKQYGGADWSSRALAAVEGKRCRYCCIQLQSEAANVDESGISRFSQEEMREMSPLDVARTFWREQIGEEMDDALVDKLTSVIARQI